MITQIRDDASIGADRYGGLNALANGVRVQVLKNNGTVVQELDGGQPIRSFADWQKHDNDGDPQVKSRLSVADDTYNVTSIRWTFYEDTRRPFIRTRGGR
jgi:hypothetical protein